MKCYQIVVSGKVQGVFYRASTKNKALDLNINGWVENQSDGTVLIEAEGDDPEMQEFIEWCKEGPTYAKVRDVYPKEIELQKFTDFQIKH